MCIRRNSTMSTRHHIKLTAALFICAASMAAANAETVQPVQSGVSTINRCQDPRGQDARGLVDQTCRDSSCMDFDVVHVQRTVGPTFPVGCQQIALITAT